MQLGNWLWNHISKRWDKAPSTVTPKRMIATGQVVAGAHKLCWVSMNPSAANSVLELTDAIAGGGAVVFDAFHATRDHMHMVLNPPMPFTTGIYIETLTSFTSIIFGYV